MPLHIFSANGHQKLSSAYFFIEILHDSGYHFPDTHKIRPLTQKFFDFDFSIGYLDIRVYKEQINTILQMSRLNTPSMELNDFQLPSLKRFCRILAILSIILTVNKTYAQITQQIDSLAEGGFELGDGSFDANGWTVVNDTANEWHAGGVGSPFSGSSHAYISNDGGITYSYSTNLDATGHFYREVTVPVDETIIQLNFQKKNIGEAGWDRILVYTAPSLFTPTAGIPASNSTLLTGATLIYIDPATTSAYTSVNVSLPSNLAGTTFRLIFTWQSDNGGGTSPGAAIDNINLTSAIPITYTSTNSGGFWNDPNTWLGGEVPPAGNDIVIADGANVLVNQLLNYRDITIGQGTSGSLQWGTTSFNTVAGRNVLINPGAQLNAHTTGGTGQTFTVAGNFTNNGFANLAYQSSSLTFTGNTGSILGGTGTYLGDGTNGIIRSLNFTNTGSNTISTTQNLVMTSGLAHTAGSLNTNGKLIIDNTTAVFGQTLNQQVMEIVMSNMGAGYTSTPLVTISAPASGTTATAVANFDGASGTIRSITITDPGSGYIANPIVSISGGGFTTSAAAVAVVVYGISGTTNSLVQRSAEATVTGGVSINSSQGVGGLVVATGGEGYTSAPTVGFSLPTSINLVTACGSGYSSAPVVTASGGGGSGASFTTTIANGQITSIYVLNVGTGYTSEPTINISGGGGTGATAEFPIGSVATATAAISNGAVSGFIVTNPGSGYVAAPAVNLTGGGASTAATSPSCKIGLYSLTLGFFIPAVNNVPHTVDDLYPANRRLNQLSMNSAGNSATLTGGDWTIYGSGTPLTLTSGNVDMSGNNLNFSFPTYAGISPGANSYIINGGVTLSSPGGSVMRTFPLVTSFILVTGTGNLASGSNITSMTASKDLAPSGSVSPQGTVTGSKSFHLITSGACGTLPITGVAPTVTLSFNNGDFLVSDNPQLFIVQGTSVGGPWNVMSVSSGLGGLSSVGGRTTSTSLPGPIMLTGDDYFAWSSTFVYEALNYEVTRNTGIDYQDISADGFVLNVVGSDGSTISVESMAGLVVGDAISYVSGGTGGFEPNTKVTSMISPTEFEVSPAPTVALTNGARIFVSHSNTYNAITGVSADDATANVSISGTSFYHSGSVVSSMTIGNNGYIIFDGGSLLGSAWNNAMAGTTRTLAPFWDDIISPGHTTPGAISPWCFYQVDGDLGSGTAVITVQWKGMETFQSSGPDLNFQVRLYEADNRIEFNYGQMEGFVGVPGINGANVYSYSVGMTNNLAYTTNPQPGQVLAQQIENTRNFSPYFSSITSRGSNYLATVPECNSQIVFTPGVYTPYADTPILPANDEPVNAILLTPSTSPPTDFCGTYYTSKGATQTVTPPAAVCGSPMFNNNDDDVWFKFQCLNDTTHVEVASSSGYDAMVEVYADATPGTFSGVPGALEFCQNNTLEGLKESLEVTNLTVGNWYYVRVYHKHGGVQAQAVATIINGVVTAITLTNGGSGYMNGAYGGTITGSPLVYIVGGGGQNAVAQAITSGTNANPAAISGITVLNGGTGYTSPPQVYIQYPGGGISGDFAISVYQNLDAPEFDDACNALPVTVEQDCNLQQAPFSTGATNSGIPACAGNADDDVWLTFEASVVNTLVTIDGANNYQAQLEVFASDDNLCSGNLTSIACAAAANSGGEVELLVNDLQIGFNYFVRVYHAGTGAGSGLFEYCISTPCSLQGTCGCTQQDACNYDMNALYDNGSCDFSCYGCMDEAACNYDALAVLSGPCDYCSCGNPACGCTDIAGCNYDPTSLYNDGSCDYESCYGCMNAIADNYDPTATIDDGSCYYYGSGATCSNPIELTCGSGLIENFTSGVINDNLNSQSNVCAGSSFAGQRWYVYNAELSSEVTIGTLSNYTSYDSYIKVFTGTCGDFQCLTQNNNSQTPGYESFVTFNAEAGTTYFIRIGGFSNLTGGFGFYMDCGGGCLDPAACNYDINAPFDDGSCGYGVECNGCTNAIADNYHPTATVDDGSCEFSGIIQVYCDLDGDGVNDPGEPGMLNWPLHIPELGITVFTNQAGFADITFPQGSYEVILGNIANFTYTTPTTATLTIPQTSDVFFGVVPFAILFSVVENIGSPILHCTNGYIGGSCIYNSGTATLSGVLTMTCDGMFTPGSATEGVSPDITSPGFAEWYIVPFSYGVFAPRFKLEGPGVELLGQQFDFNFHLILTDEFGVEVYNSQWTLNLQVACAYDPNDIAVTPVGYADPHFVAKGEELVYKIRFQNTGNLPAEDISINNIIDPAVYDVSTFTPVISSDYMTTCLHDDGTIDFLFNDVYLPDSVHNEPESHGWLIYKVNLWEDIDANTVASNFADIYFEQNPPVTTNTVFNTVFDCTSFSGIVGESEFCEGEMVLLSGDQLYVDEYSWMMDSDELSNTSALETSDLSVGDHTINLTVSNPICDMTHSSDITVNPLPIINAGDDAIVCEGSAVILQATSDGSITWSGGQINGEAYYPSDSEVLQANATNDFGCSASDEMNIILAALPGTVLGENGSTLTAPDGASWQWYFNNELMTGVTTQTIVVTQSGNYYVVTTSENDCTSSSESVFVTNLSENNQNELRVYPNPIREMALVQLPSGIYHIRLLDATGKLALDLGNHQNSFVLERSGLASGKYQLELSNANVQTYINLVFE